MGRNVSTQLSEFPIGTIMQSEMNLETITNGKWISMDGRELVRSSYPEISSYYSAGVFTRTTRTLSSPCWYPYSVASDSTNFLIPASNTSGAALQASPDGVTWTTSVTWNANTAVSFILKAGSRFVACGSGGDFSGASLLYFANVDQGAAATCNKSAWTGSTGGTISINQTQAMAYSPTLGRIVAIPTSAGTTIYTVEDGSVALVTRSHTTSRTKQAVIWTGSKFIIFTDDNHNIILVSSDGITWTEQKVSNPITYTASAATSFATDGNGTVVATIGQYYVYGAFMVSKDHGVTWRRILFPSWARQNRLDGQTAYPACAVVYVNGKFIAFFAGGYLALCSYDGISWQGIDLYQANNTGTVLLTNALGYKNGVYLTLSITAGSNCSTYTEDMTKFRIHDTAMPASSNNANWSDTCALHQEYMKVKS